MIPLRSLLPLFLSCFLVGVAGPAVADDSLLSAAEEIRASVAAEPRVRSDLYDASFLISVSEKKLRSLYADFHAQHGAMKEIALLSRASPHSGKFEARFEKGTAMPVSLTLAAEPPHRVVGLWFGPPAPALASLGAVVAELRKLPGKVSFLAARLPGKGREEIEEVSALEPDLPLAIGSSFKLYVLGALVREVRAKKRHWSDVVLLEKPRFSLPSGQLQEWPAGSPLTLHTLAALMISRSDNTATDHLLFALGRERVEAMLEPMGNRTPAGNVPFLATSEMFRLKGIDGGKPGEAYLKMTAAAKRRYLEKELPLLPLERVDGGALARPSMIESLEWFASARELCRAMDWLRRETEAGPAAPARAILAINPGLGVPRDRFPYVGYKGGSESGVLNLTFLLRGDDGGWWALSAGWNDPREALDEAKFTGLVTRALALLRPAPAK